MKMQIIIIIIRYNSGVKLIIIASCKHKNNLQKAYKNKNRFCDMIQYNAILVAQLKITIVLQTH